MRVARDTVNATMNEKAASAQQKALQERKRGQHAKAVKRLEQAIASFPEELDLHLDAIDACLEGGEVTRATQILKTVQDKFTKDKDRIAAFVREKLIAVHDPALARFVVENSIKLRDLVNALDHLDQIPDHTVRDLLSRTRTKKQSLKSASHGGYSLRGELLTNELMSALLSIRLGNMKEGVAAIVQILDEKPVEQAILTPFLTWLEGRHAKSGRVQFAYACGQCASGAELEGINRFVDAARLEPPVASLCVDRLKVLRETSKARTRVERALAEVYLLKGDLDDGAAVLRDYLATEKDAGREVMLLVRPFIDPANGINACTWLALDASLSVEQSNVALEILRPLHQRAKCTEDLLNWFETKARDSFLTPEMMTFHATLALEQKKYERTAEILRAVCAKAPQEVPAVLAMLDRHRSSHESIDALYREYAAKDADAGGDAADVDDDGFQNFDNKTFGLPAVAPTAAPEKAATGPAAPEHQPLDFAATMRSKVQKKSFVETRDISFDDDDVRVTQPAPAPAPQAAPPAGDIDGFEISDGPSMGGRSRLTSTRSDDNAPAITEEHVTNVGQKLYETGAAAFFHVDAEDVTTAAANAPPEPAGSPPGSTDTAAVSAPEPVVAAAALEPVVTAADITPETQTPATFNDLYEEFRNGRLDNTRVIALMETAVEEGRADELGELIQFEPRGEAEIFARRYFEAEHMILSNRPLPAMKILASLDVPALPDEQKHRVWFKLAVCQRSIRDFTGANETLTRLVEAFPDREEYARLARTNFEQHLSEQSQQTTVLEKTSSLE